MSRINFLGTGWTPRSLRSHHECHANYPTERSGPVPVEPVIPPGRCAFCWKRPGPCAHCQDLAKRCRGCFRLKCDGSHVLCDINDNFEGSR